MPSAFDIQRAVLRAASGKTVDIVLSQSCLEHVFPIEGTFESWRKYRIPATRFLHLVDFGNHYPTGKPFEGLYEHPPADYIARRGQGDQSLRVSDIARLFAKFGIGANDNVRRA